MIRTLRRYIATDGNDNKEYIYIACLSTDTKPTTGIITGSAAIEVDTGKRYEFNEVAGEWVEQPASGGGGGSGLPPVTSEDNGKVLTADNGEWAAKAAGGALVVTINQSASTMTPAFADVVAAYEAGREIVMRVSTQTGTAQQFHYMANVNVGVSIIGTYIIYNFNGETVPDENNIYYEVSVNSSSVTATPKTATVGQAVGLTWNKATNSLRDPFDYTQYDNGTPIKVNVVYEDSVYHITESYPTISGNANLYKSISGMPMFDKCYVDAICIYDQNGSLNEAILHIDFLNSANTTYTYKTITTT